MHRFFVPPESLRGGKAEITGPQVHQICNVLRMGPGDQFTVLDDSGWEYQVEIEVVDRERIEARILNKKLAATEPRTKITLYQAVLRAQNFELVLQKGTELGVVEFVPIITDRCVISALDEVSESKLQRWQRIIQEAAEQSGRGRLPRLRPVLLFLQACERARYSDLALIPWEEEHRTTLRSVLTSYPANWRPFSVSVFVGPEGGFTNKEMDHARRYGITPVTMGPRVLRAETAAIAMTAALFYEFGDWGR